jgi:hypothetical protein
LIAPTPRSMLAGRWGRLLREHKCACEGIGNEGQQKSHVASTCGRAQMGDTLDLAPEPVKRRRLSDQ